MSLNINSLKAVTPIDGRYATKTRHLAEYFSEFALNKYRLKIEIKYLNFFLKLITSNFKTNLKNHNGNKYQLTNDILLKLQDIYSDFSDENCLIIKLLEVSCNHDVKAVEYYIRDCLDNLELSYLKPYIHYGLTSQDINNTSITLSLKDYITKNYLPSIEYLNGKIQTLADKYKHVSMLSRTHGQSAVPSTMGKELKVFEYRIGKQIQQLKDVTYYGKFGGAVGNFNAHIISYPEIDWVNQTAEFLKTEFGLIREEFTTQIDNYENLAVLFDCIRRINTILIDLCKDIWHYISIEYFVQSVTENEVGSSTMPQKVNPIEFENSEGNLLLANSIFNFLSNKLPISRLQRDLTDSTILRNLGTVFGYVDISLVNLSKGLDKIRINHEIIDKDLSNNYYVLTEAIQTVLRKEGVQNAYEIIKEFSRNNEKLSQEKYVKFIYNLDEISAESKQVLIDLTPDTYIGNAANW